LVNFTYFGLKTAFFNNLILMRTKIPRGGQRAITVLSVLKKGVYTLVTSCLFLFSLNTKNLSIEHNKKNEEKIKTPFLFCNVPPLFYLFLNKSLTFLSFFSTFPCAVHC